MTILTLHGVPFEVIAREVPLFVHTTPAGFPSPAQDDMEEPIDLAAWLIDHPAASYVMRVAGHSMVDAGIRALHRRAGGAGVQARLADAGGREVAGVDDAHCRGAGGERVTACS